MMYLYGLPDRPSSKPLRVLNGGASERSPNPEREYEPVHASPDAPSEIGQLRGSVALWRVIAVCSTLLWIIQIWIGRHPL